MMESRRLTKKQLAVIDDLIAGELEQKQILKKHETRPTTFKKWLAAPAFKDELERRTEWLTHRSELILASYKSVAAGRLVELTQSQNQETARKACLDILNRTCSAADGSAKTQVSADESEKSLPADTASKLLAVLAHRARDEGGDRRKAG
jgi:hypothetical protein